MWSLWDSAPQLQRPCFGLEQDLDTKSQSKIKNLTVRHGQRGQRGFVDDDILLIVIIMIVILIIVTLVVIMVVILLAQYG